ncbi:CWF19-like protein 2 homolog [Anopheles darlingi]|uniref:CWF19-like protein 2 homolog n=1 Tax=Anopheles darlingi TaxID=43151 RepID=UPI002100204D|nr:CWF19-like protein 2 homolog [Anopheles darlingi]
MGSSSSDSESFRKQRKHKKKEKKSKKSKKEKKHKKDKKHKRQRRSSSSSSSGSASDAWIEALPGSANNRVAEKDTAQQHPPPVKLEREDWMNSMLIPTYSKEPKKEDSKTVAAREQYDPKTSVRELNPHWRNGGSGLPSFRKPANDEDNDDDYPRHGRKDEYKPANRVAAAGGWKKASNEVPITKQREPPQDTPEERSTEKSSTTTQSETRDEQFLTDQQLNDLGAKLIKAELLGNTEQAERLRDQLAKAKAYRMEVQTKKSQEPTSKRRPIDEEESITYTARRSAGESQRYAEKKQKRYQQNLPPGPDLSDKFRSERHDNASMDAQFFKVSAKMGEGKRLENIFDHQKATSSAADPEACEERSVREMNQMSKAQADCERCLNSGRFAQEQLISMGKNVFLSIPTWRALQPKHCFIVPVSHYPCLTQVDEDVHREIVDVCKALVAMFRKHQMEVVFFETVRYLNRNPHMYIQCVPARNYEMAPFYFKKAILESETEWAMNKKLHNVDGFNVRRIIPKGLPYFWVNFNLENGFAHVIEDQEEFPVTFATETIAGILGLDTREWRKPRKEMNPAQKVAEFKRWWQEFDSVLIKD